jgi:hypothetical protein
LAELEEGEEDGLELHGEGRREGKSCVKVDNGRGWTNSPLGELQEGAYVAWECGEIFEHRRVGLPELGVRVKNELQVIVPDKEVAGDAIEQCTDEV